MFKVKGQEFYLKGLKIVDPGSFKDSSGNDVSYDGYKQLIVSMYSKNDELVDIKCRFPNNSIGDDLYLKFRQIPLMTKLNGDFEIQVSKNGSSKFFIVGIND